MSDIKLFVLRPYSFLFIFLINSFCSALMQNVIGFFDFIWSLVSKRTKTGYKHKSRIILVENYSYKS